MGMGWKDSGPCSPADGDAEAPRASSVPAVSFSSDTTDLRRRPSSSTPCDPHVIGPQISRHDAERAGHLYLQTYATDRVSRASRSRRSSSRATARCQNAVPQSLRAARPGLMKAVLDDTDNGAQLRQGLAAVKRAQTLKLMNQFVGKRQAEITVCQRRCKGRCTHGRVAMSASMGVLLLSVGLMLMILFYQQQVVSFFLYSGTHIWDADDSRTSNTGSEYIFQQHFELNEPMGGFISVTGLVFALVFASNYTDAQCRLNEIRNSLAVEAGGVHTAMLLVRTLDEDDPAGAFKSRVLLLLASYIEHLAEEITWAQTGHGKQPPPSNVEILYATIPFLSEIGSDGDGDDMDRVLVQRTVDALNASSEARQIRVSQEKRNISPYVYCFLWQMAFVTYLGVIFLQAGSQLMNTCVALLTITSVTTSMLILADLEKPYDGLVRVETDIFDTIRRDISVMLHDVEGSAGEAGDYDSSETGATCDARADGGGSGCANASAEAAVAAGSRSNDPRPARIRTMSMRTKIDADYHMREAVSQIGRLRRHSVDCSGVRSPASPLTPLSSLSGTNDANNNPTSADNSATSGGSSGAFGGSEKYRVSSLPNAITT